MTYFGAEVISADLIEINRLTATEAPISHRHVPRGTYHWKFRHQGRCGAAKDSNVPRGTLAHMRGIISETAANGLIDPWI